LDFCFTSCSVHAFSLSIPPCPFSFRFKSKPTLNFKGRLAQPTLSIFRFPGFAFLRLLRLAPAFGFKLS
jgi:hypothetical protein